MPLMVCIDCWETWASSCPKCGSEQFCIKVKTPTCSFYDWLEREKKINLRAIKDEGWDVLWAEYVRIMGWI